jgi:hypothetical protein
VELDEDEQKEKTYGMDDQKKAERNYTVSRKK